MKKLFVKELFKMKEIKGDEKFLILDNDSTLLMNGIVKDLPKGVLDCEVISYTVNYASMKEPVTICAMSKTEVRIINIWKEVERNEREPGEFSDGNVNADLFNN